MRPAVVKLIWLAQSFALLDYLISGAAGRNRVGRGMNMP